jgi:hypothetical protein
VVSFGTRSALADGRARSPAPPSAAAGESPKGACRMAQIRNVALLSHSGAGKTSLLEAMLFRAGAIPKMGRVEDGNTASDTSPRRSGARSRSTPPCTR